jgi:hypothetical protein
MQETIQENLLVKAAIFKIRKQSCHMSKQKHIIIANIEF